ncbi:tetratricopeptide repeat protein [Synechococcus moorigangaii CMS01]|nr:tetratricopeptide repeat protein [Synechococcus moorigangaii CMS01]
MFIYLPNRVDKTLEDFSGQIAANPDNLEAYFARGNRHYELKRYEEAIADFTQAITLDNNYLNACTNFGIADAEGK